MKVNKYFKFGAISGGIGWLLGGLLNVWGMSLPSSQSALQQITPNSQNAPEIGLPLMGVAVIVTFVLTIIASGVIYRFGKYVMDWADIHVRRSLFKVMSAGVVGNVIVGTLLIVAIYGLLSLTGWQFISPNGWANVPNLPNPQAIANMFLISGLVGMVISIPVQLGRDVITWGLYKALDWNPEREFGE